MHLPPVLFWKPLERVPGCVVGRIRFRGIPSLLMHARSISSSFFFSSSFFWQFGGGGGGFVGGFGFLVGGGEDFVGGCGFLVGGGRGCRRIESRGTPPLDSF